MSTIKIDLYSDTSTKPTRAMRAFMCEAEVGDEQKGEDPSVNALQDQVAELLGKEAALLLPSGTMCNQIAYAVHCRAGDLILMDRTAHPLISEAGGAAVLARATMYPIDGDHGMFTPEQMAAVMEAPTRYKPPFRLVCVEQTTNKPGGRIWPLEQIQAVCKMAHERGALTHMDGARLLNATVATGIDPKAYAASFDTLWIDLSKGLGAPIGGVLAGSAAFIQEAWQWKQRIGGAMRQAGIIAAAGSFALDHHVDRMAEDHANAKRLANGIAGAPRIQIDVEGVETNMVRFDVADLGVSSSEFGDLMLSEFGIRVSAPGPTLVRLIPHLGITETDVDTAAEAIQNLAKKLAS
ncbi:MAG: threonine aldolase family protein [Candidatus Latescibacteria bacterium]|nr:threonine aldolase family protein [Candidatus Latescibacterota bacterium]